jgi:FKBP-type peptidyl-prolyl cis-trans isomerase
MKEGGKSKLFIPSEIGYGDQPMGNVIKPGSTLIFEVELFKVED